MKNKFSGRLFIGIYIICALVFSTWLSFHTFSYAQGNILIGAKAWSDFSWTIPMIRSFSFGSNFPVEAPLFPGEPIHYHFIFYFLVGILEKIGIRIDYALNIPSIIGLTGLLFMLYLFAKKLFNSTTVGILSIIFFLFNGTFSFIYFFLQHPLSLSTFQDIFLNNTFSSFAPYDEKIVTAFWNLNIYTNQRHLAGAFALSLAILYVFLEPVFSKQKIVSHYLLKSVILGIILGLMFYFHLAILLMTFVAIAILILLFKKLRFSGIVILTLCSIISLPQYLYLNSGGSSFKLLFNPGYLTSTDFDLYTFGLHWAMNLGLHFLLIPVGLFLSSWKQRKIFLAFFASFIVGNIFQFSPDIAGNHKFFNFFMLIGNMFSAYSLYRIWKWKIVFRPLVIIFVFLLILSGIIDFFPVYNDKKITLVDYPNNPDVEWIMKNTPPNSVFLNTQYLYSPESLAGRKVFLGWPYFAWSAGYDTHKRGQIRDEILASVSEEHVCRLLKKNNISYIEISSVDLNSPDQPKIPNVFKKYFTLEYMNNGIEIYNVHKSCKKI